MSCPPTRAATARRRHARAGATPAGATARGGAACPRRGARGRTSTPRRRTRHGRPGAEQSGLASGRGTPGSSRSRGASCARCPRACSPGPCSGRGDRRRRCPPSARACARSSRAPRTRATDEHRPRLPPRRAHESFVVLRVRVVVRVPPNRLDFFFQDEQRGCLGERLLLALEFALKLAHPARLDVRRLAVALARRSQRRGRGAAPLGKLRLVHTLSPQERAELLRRYCGSLEHERHLLLGGPVLGPLRRRRRLLLLLVTAGHLRRDRTCCLQPFRERRLCDAGLTGELGCGRCVWSGQSFDHPIPETFRVESQWVLGAPRANGGEERGRSGCQRHATTTLAQGEAERDRLREAYEALTREVELARRRLIVAKAERIDTTQLELEFAAKLAALDELAGKVDDDEAGEAPKPERDRAKKKHGRRDLRLLD